MLIVNMFSFKKGVIPIAESPLQILRLFSLWPEEHALIKNTTSYKRKAFITILYRSWIFIGGLIHIITSINAKTPLDLSENLGMTVSLSACLYVQSIFVSKSDGLSKVLKELSDSTSFGVSPCLEPLNKRLNIFNRFHLMYCSMGFSIYGLTNYLNRSECEEMNLKFNLIEFCGGLTSIYVPVNVNFFPVRELIFLLQFWTAFPILIAAGTIMFLQAHIAEIFTAKFGHLEGLFRTSIAAKNRKQFNLCIEYHIELIRLAELVNGNFSLLNLVHIVVTSFVLGSIAHQTLRNFSFGALVHLIGWLVGLRFVCLAGKTLQNCSTKLAIEVYCTEWYNAPLNIQKDLLLIIKRAQKPLSLTAGPISNLNEETSVTIVKAAYSYMMVLTKA